MEDIEKIEEIIEMADITPIYEHPEKHYLRAIAKTQILILEEMRKQDEDRRKISREDLLDDDEWWEAKIASWIYKETNSNSLN